MEWRVGEVGGMCPGGSECSGKWEKGGMNPCGSRSPVRREAGKVGGMCPGRSDKGGRDVSRWQREKWDPPPSRGWEVELARVTPPRVPGPRPQ